MLHRHFFADRIIQLVILYQAIKLKIIFGDTSTDFVKLWYEV